MRGRCGHSDTPWGSMGSSGVVGFTTEHSGGLWGHVGSLGSSAVIGYTRVRP